MLYLSLFRLPSLAREEDHERRFWALGNPHPHEYPYGIFPFKHLSNIDFSEITIFYGGNGSGKTTLLNIIAEALNLPRITPFNRSTYFNEYATRMCSYVASGGRPKNSVPNGSAIFTSDDVFYGLIDRRVDNEETMYRRDECTEEYLKAKGRPFSRFNGLDDYDELVRQLDAKRKTMRQYVDHYAGTLRTPDSNGEYALAFFREHLMDGRLYLLDEPENSLSPKYQLRLIQLLQELSRFYNCQFIIASHSPFIMSMKGALIYDLDSDPVETRAWYELESMKLYFDLFMEHRDKFE